MLLHSPLWWKSLTWLAKEDEGSLEDPPLCFAARAADEAAAMAADDAAEEPPERAPMLEGAWENGTMLAGAVLLGGMMLSESCIPML